MPVRLVAMLVCCLLLVGAPTHLRAGKFNALISAHNVAPRFADLPGIDGKTHSLSDFHEAKFVVVVFTCCHSPCATAYEGRLTALDRDYGGRGVQFVAISVSRSAADSLPRMKEQAVKAGFGFPYLRDESQQIGRQFGATVTPQAFVLDDARKVRYLGRIDDQLDEVDVRKRYLRDALDALLDGREPKVVETKPEGCSIKYE